jgi:hypothetical protein
MLILPLLLLPFSLVGMIILAVIEGISITVIFTGYFKAGG